MTLGALNPRYGKGLVDIAEGDLPVALDGIAKRLHESFRSGSKALPLPPGVALEVMQLSQHPEVTAEKISAVLQRDPMLAGATVKVASSPLYGGKEVKSLRDAVVRLGSRGLHDIIMEAAMHLKVFRSKRYGELMEQVRRHCVATAHVARIVCRHTAVDAEHAFMCGLFHDAGAAAALLILEDDKSHDLHGAELAGVLSAVHLEGVRALALAWKLPADVAFVVGNHHQLLHQGYPHPVIAALLIAEDVLRELVGPMPFDSSQGDVHLARQALSITPAVDELIHKAAREVFAQLS